MAVLTNHYYFIENYKYFSTPRPGKKFVNSLNKAVTNISGN